MLVFCLGRRCLRYFCPALPRQSYCSMLWPGSLHRLYTVWPMEALACSIQSYLLGSPNILAAFSTRIWWLHRLYWALYSCRRASPEECQLFAYRIWSLFNRLDWYQSRNWHRSNRRAKIASETQQYPRACFLLRLPTASMDQLAWILHKATSLLQSTWISIARPSSLRTDRSTSKSCAQISGPDHQETHTHTYTASCFSLQRMATNALASTSSVGKSSQINALL